MAETTEAEIDGKRLSELSVKELRFELGKRGLPRPGTKEELIQRLTNSVLESRAERLEGELVPGLGGWAPVIKQEKPDDVSETTEAEVQVVPVAQSLHDMLLTPKQDPDTLNYRQNVAGKRVHYQIPKAYGIVNNIGNKNEKMGKTSLPSASVPLENKGTHLANGTGGSSGRNYTDVTYRQAEPGQVDNQGQFQLSIASHIFEDSLSNPGAVNVDNGARIVSTQDRRQQNSAVEENRALNDVPPEDAQRKAQRSSAASCPGNGKQKNNTPVKVTVLKGQAVKRVETETVSSTSSSLSSASGGSDSSETEKGKDTQPKQRVVEGQVREENDVFYVEVSGMPPSANARGLKKLFQCYAKLAGVKIVENKHGVRFGVVTVRSYVSAASCVKNLNASKLGGRSLTVRFLTGPLLLQVKSLEGKGRQQSCETSTPEEGNKNRTPNSSSAAAAAPIQNRQASSSTTAPNRPSSSSSVGAAKTSSGARSQSQRYVEPRSRNYPQTREKVSREYSRQRHDSGVDRRVSVQHRENRGRRSDDRNFFRRREDNRVSRHRSDSRSRGYSHSSTRHTSQEESRSRRNASNSAQARQKRDRLARHDEIRRRNDATRKRHQHELPNSTQSLLDPVLALNTLESQNRTELEELEKGREKIRAEWAKVELKKRQLIHEEKCRQEREKARIEQEKLELEQIKAKLESRKRNEEAKKFENCYIRPSTRRNENVERTVQLVQDTSEVNLANRTYSSRPSFRESSCREYPRDGYEGFETGAQNAERYGESHSSQPIRPQNARQTLEYKNAFDPVERPTSSSSRYVFDPHCPPPFMPHHPHYDFGQSSANPNYRPDLRWQAPPPPARHNLQQQQRDWTRWDRADDGDGGAQENLAYNYRMAPPFPPEGDHDWPQARAAPPEPQPQRIVYVDNTWDGDRNGLGPVGRRIQHATRRW